MPAAIRDAAETILIALTESDSGLLDPLGTVVRLRRQPLELALGADMADGPAGQPWVLADAAVLRSALQLLGPLPPAELLQDQAVVGPTVAVRFPGWMMETGQRLPPAAQLQLASSHAAGAATREGLTVWLLRAPDGAGVSDLNERPGRQHGR